MCGFDGVKRGIYLGGDPIRRTDVEVRLGKLKNGKVASKDEVTGEMVKGGGDMVLNWIWRFGNMAFENGIVCKDWRSTVIASLYKGRGLNLRILDVVGKI